MMEHTMLYCIVTHGRPNILNSARFEKLTTGVTKGNLDDLTGTNEALGRFAFNRSQVFEQVNLNRILKFYYYYYFTYYQVF